MALPPRARRVLRNIRQAVPSGVVLGRRSAGEGPAEFIQLDEIQQAQLDAISSTHGAILFRGALEWDALPPGTAGEVLTTGGAGADPTWAASGGGGGASWWFAPPKAADFPTTVLGTGTTLTLGDDADIGLTLDGDVYVTSDRTRACFKALPAAASFSVKCRLTMELRTANFAGAGLIIRNSSNSRLLMLRAAYSAGSIEYSGLRSTNENTFSGNITGVGSGYGGGPVFFRFDYDHVGGTYTGLFSMDGKQWVRVFLEAAATFITTGDQIGLGFVSNLADSNRRMLMSCDYWEQDF